MGLLPRMTMLNTVDGAYANPVVLRYSGKRKMADFQVVPNLSNFLRGQLRLVIVGSMRLAFPPAISNFAKRALVASNIGSAFPLLPSLFHHISHVFAMRSSNKVVWVDATGVVANMQNTQPVRNRAVEQMVGDTMAHPDSLAVVDELDRRISLIVLRVLPLPATRFRNGVPFMKTLNEIFFTHNNFSIGLSPNYTEVGRIV